MKSSPNSFFQFLIAIIVLFVLPIRFAWSETFHYKIDPQSSHFFVTTGSSGVFGAFGHNHKIAIPSFKGDVVFDPSDPSSATLVLNIDSNSLYVVADNKKEEEDKPKIEEKMRSDVLEVTEFPEIVYRSTKVTATPTENNEFEAGIIGDLTLHGVTTSVPITAKIKLEKDRLNAKGEFSIKQTDFKIKPVSAAGGTVKVKNQIHLNFDMVARP